jgi:hypothetical protein
LDDAVTEPPDGIAEHVLEWPVVERLQNSHEGALDQECQQEDRDQGKPEAGAAVALVSRMIVR